MNGLAARSTPAALGLSAVVLGALLTGHPGAALGAVGLVCGVLFVAACPARVSALAVLFLALVLEGTQQNPAAGLWMSPNHAVGQWFLDNLSKLTGAPIPFSLMDLLVLGAALGIAVREADGRPERSARNAGCAVLAACAYLGAIALAVLHGLLTHAAKDPLYWQIRETAYLPVIALLFLGGLRREDVPRAGAAVVLAATLKALLAVYTVYAVFLPRGLHPRYVTTHSDTVLFVLALAILVARVLAHGLRHGKLALLTFGPVILWGMVLNQRRLAYSALFGSLLLIGLLQRSARVKRALWTAGLVLTPLLAGYVVAGSHSKAAIFTPVHAFQSMGSDADSSTRFRDVENFNLSQTLRARPLFGQGLGHPFRQVERNDDISDVFELYPYIPHNQVLGLLCVGGIALFPLWWALLVVTAYLGARALRFADAPDEQAAGLAAICAVLIYAMQLYGDMGTQDWSGTVLIAAALAVASKVAVAVRGYPAATRASAGVGEWRPCGSTA